ncbi:MAG: translocation/assembly module TamB domain-containing protein [Rhodothalassiaceae bacterium]
MPTWIYRALAGLAVSVLLIVGGLHAADAQFIGRDWILDRLEGLLSNEERQVRIIGASGSLLGTLRVDAIRVEDDQGAWLVLEEAVLDWSPTALAGRRIAVRALQVERARLERLPESQPSEQPSEPLALPDLPVTIDVVNLRIGRLELSPEVAQTETALRLAGHARIARSGAVDVDLQAEALQGAQDTVSVDLRIDPEADRVQADIQADLPRGGLVSRLAGGDAGGRLALTAAGKLSRGDGEISLAWGPASASGAVQWRPNGGGARLTLTPGDLVPDPARPWIGSAPDLDLDLAQLTGEGATLGLTATLASGSVSLTGPVRFDDLLALDGKRLEARLQPPQGVLPDGQSIGTVTAAADLSGTLAMPAVEARLRADTAKAATFAASAIVMTAKVARQDSGFDVDARADVTDATLNGTPLGDLGARIDAVIDPGGPAAEIDQARLDLPEGAIVARGQFDAGSKRADLELDGSLPALAAYGPLLGRDLAGALTLSARLQRSAAERDWAMRVRLAGDRLDLGEASLNAVLGPAPELVAEARVNDDGAIAVPRLELDARRLALAATAAVSAEGALDGQYRLRMADLDAIEALEALALTGDFELAGSLGGTATDPGLTARAGLDQLRVQDVLIQDMRLEVGAVNLATAPYIETSVSGRSTIGPLAGRVLVEPGEAGGLLVPDITLSIGGLSLDGQLTVPPDAPLEGMVTVLARADDEAVRGFDGNVDLSVELSGQDGRQRIAVDGRAGQIESPLPGDQFLRLDQAALQGFALTGGDALPDVEMHVSVTDLFVGLNHLEEAQVTVSGTGDVSRFKADLYGLAGAPFDVTATGFVDLEATGGEAELRLDGNLARRPIELTQPVRLSWTAGDFLLQPVSLLWGEGSLSLQAERQAGQLDAVIGLAELDLGLVGSFVAGWPVKGVVNGAVAYQGEGRQGEGRLAIQARDLRPFTGGADLEPAVLNLEGQLDDGRLRLSGRLDDPFGAQARIQAALPMRVNAQSLSPIIPEGAQLAASAAWQGEIEGLMILLALPDQEARGLLDLDLRLEGPLQTPALSGTLDFDDGYYENDAIGFVADAVHLAADVNDQRLTITEFTATDGEDGAMEADGHVEWMARGLGSTGLLLTLDEMVLVRRPDIRGAASADLSLIGDGDGLALAGRVDLDRANVQLIDPTTRSIPTLDVVEIHGDMPVSEPDQSAEDGGIAVPPIRLDVTIDIPNQLFVRGRGLESEWQGDISVTGTAEQPVLRGSVSVLTGQFDFAGDRFDLARGEVVLDGGREIDPRLDVRAQTEVETSGTDYTAILEVTGRTSEPEITLSSEPALPEDEILALILFGTNVSELGPGEALELALTLNTLRSGGEGLQGRARRTLGLDRLSLGEDTQEDTNLPTITGGKYLTNNIYLELTTATATGDTSAQLEVELTDNLSLVSRLGLQTDNNLGVRWSFDY